MRLWLLVITIALMNLAQAESSRVMLDTDRGAIFLELDSSSAPANVESLLEQIDHGFLLGKVFHHAESNYVLVGSRNHILSERPPASWTEVDESSNGLLNTPRSVGISFGRQFGSTRLIDLYFNMERNVNLDGRNPVIGSVTGGWAMIQELAESDTWSLRDMPFLPQAPLTIRRAFEFDRYPVLPIHSGSWFDPQNPGVGFNLEVTNQNSADDQPILIFYWYDFNQGEPLWLTGSAAFDWGDDEVTVELLAIETPNPSVDFQAPPDAGAYQPRGTMTLSFNDCLTGRFSYDLPEFGTGDIDTLRLSLPDQIDCERYRLHDD